MELSWQCFGMFHLEDYQNWHEKSERRFAWLHTSKRLHSVHELTIGKHTALLVTETVHKQWNITTLSSSLHRRKAIYSIKRGIAGQDFDSREGPPMFAKSTAIKTMTPNKKAHQHTELSENTKTSLVIIRRWIEGGFSFHSLHNLSNQPMRLFITAHLCFQDRGSSKPAWWYSLGWFYPLPIF